MHFPLATSLDLGVAHKYPVVERGSFCLRERSWAYAPWNTFRGSAGGAVVNPATKKLVGIHTYGLYAVVSEEQPAVEFDDGESDTSDQNRHSNSNSLPLEQTGAEVLAAILLSRRKKRRR
jgi:hypothetical protein